MRDNAVYDLGIWRYDARPEKEVKRASYIEVFVVGLGLETRRMINSKEDPRRLSPGPGQAADSAFAGPNRQCQSETSTPAKSSHSKIIDRTSFLPSNISNRYHHFISYSTTLRSSIHHVWSYLEAILLVRIRRRRGYRPTFYEDLPG